MCQRRIRKRVKPFRIDHLSRQRDRAKHFSAAIRDAIFEPLWNTRYIESTIRSDYGGGKTLGVEHAPRYYEGPERCATWCKIIAPVALPGGDGSSNRSPPDSIRDEKSKSSERSGASSDREMAKSVAALNTPKARSRSTGPGVSPGKKRCRSKFDDRNLYRAAH